MDGFWGSTIGKCLAGYYDRKDILSTSSMGNEIFQFSFVLESISPGSEGQK